MKNTYKLLPHIKENVYGFKSKSAQIIGWELLKFNSPEIWQYPTGKNVKVSIIDTGCDIKHNDIKTNIKKYYNAIDKTKKVNDDNGHGTHVAGTIGAINNSLGTVGVAPECDLYIVKSLDANGSADSNSISEGILWSVNQKCDIITMSLGSLIDSKKVKKAIDIANKNNITIFCAAGNSGNDNEIMYPAKYDNTISVGSVDQNLCISDFSCLSDELNFLSPGQDILSCAPNNGYALMSGTSMSTPFVVGCAALYLSYCRINNLKEPRNYDDYINFFDTFTIKPSCRPNNKIKCGIVNLPIDKLTNLSSS